MNTLARIQKELKAPKNNKNLFGNYNYRSCEDILEAVKPLLGDATLTISDEIVVLGDNHPVIYDYKEQYSEYVDNKKVTKERDVKGIAGEQRFYVKATATLKDSTNPEKIWQSTAYARESFDKKGMDAAQITGSASSYARKYALNGLFCIDDTKDADSTNTHGKEENTSMSQPSAPNSVNMAPPSAGMSVDEFDFK